MTWNDHHRRGDVLRAVETAADERRDGVLPAQLPGVAETFTDEADLVAALLLRWHARLSSRLEQALAREPMDLQGAVAQAWTATAEQLPGVRLVLDRLLDGPETDASRVALRARELERGRLAAAAGLGGAVEAGRRIEEQARAALDLDAVPAARTEPVVATPAATTSAPSTPPSTRDTASFVERIRAALAA